MEKSDLPKGWRRVKLGNYAKIKTGNSNVEDATDEGLYPLFDRSLTVKRSNKYFLDAEAVIVPGEGSEFTPKYYNGKFDLHQRAYAIFDFDEELYGKYLFYFMHLAAKELIRFSVGTTVVSLRLPQFLNLQILLPPLPEQRKIAEILETVDKALEKTDQIIENYKRIKQGLMQDLLTRGIDEQGRIRSEETHEFKDSPLGQIPAEWEVVALGEVAQLRNKKAIPPLGEKYIGLENIEKGTGILNGYIPTQEIKGVANIFKKGDILFGKLRPNLRKYWYATFNGYCSTELLVIIPKNSEVTKGFLYLVVQSRNFLKLAESKVFGTKMPRTSWNILRNYKFPLPPLPEQKRIAEILSQIDRVIEEEQKYKEKLERLKRGLMEDLLSGKVRVTQLLKESGG